MKTKDTVTLTRKNQTKSLTKRLKVNVIVDVICLPTKHAFQVELEFGKSKMFVFVEGGKLENPEKNPRESNPGHIGGRRMLSPLHHPCSPKFVIIL